MIEIKREDHRRAATYFDESGRLFDSLYSLEKSGAVMRFMNKHFRSDIYVRYMMTVDHLNNSGAKSVLDIGIGGARYAEGYLKAGVTRVIGVDISKTMLELAREHVSSLPNHEKIFEFVLSDLDAFKCGSPCDVVVAMGLFDYLTDTLAALKKMKEMCNHSVIASFPSISFYRTPIRKVRYKLKNCPVFFFRREQIIELSSKAGFSSCSVKKIDGAGMDYVAIFKV